MKEIACHTKLTSHHVIVIIKKGNQFLITKGKKEMSIEERVGCWMLIPLKNNGISSQASPIEKILP